MLVEATLGSLVAFTATPAGTVAITVPLPIIPETATLNVVPFPGGVTIAVVAPAVPVKTTSPVAKPLTTWSNTTVKLIGETDVGSGCPAAWFIVTVGGTAAPGKITVTVSLKVTLTLAALNKLERRLTVAMVCINISSTFQPVAPTLASEPKRHLNLTFDWFA